MQRYYSFGSGNGSGGTILEARGLKDANKGEGRDNARREINAKSMCATQRLETGKRKREIERKREETRHES